MEIKAFRVTPRLFTLSTDIRGTPSRVMCVYMHTYTNKGSTTFLEGVYKSKERGNQTDRNERLMYAINNSLARGPFNCTAKNKCTHSH